MIAFRINYPKGYNFKDLPIPYNEKLLPPGWSCDLIIEGSVRETFEGKTPSDALNKLLKGRR